MAAILVHQRALAAAATSCDSALRVRIPLATGSVWRRAAMAAWMWQWPPGDWEVFRRLWGTRGDGGRGRVGLRVLMVR